MVQGVRKNTLAAEVQARTHTLISGVGATNGGGDEGANPHELLEAALSACTIITVQMYASRKGWPLEGTDVKVQILSEGEQTEIQRDIQFRGPLDHAQVQRLGEIANKCPIHRLLEGQVNVQTVIAAPTSAPPA